MLVVFKIVKWIYKLFIQSILRRSVILKRFHSPRFYLLLFISILGCCLYYFLKEEEWTEDFDLNTRNAERKLKEQLKYDKGTGCNMPKLDPFSKEATQFDVEFPKIVCDGQDWVKCYHSECKVSKVILDQYTHIVCTYRDIIYENDFSYYYGGPVEVAGAGSYYLKNSDHAKVSCSGFKDASIFAFFPSRWSGNVAGFRSEVHREPSPKGREDSLNVMIFAFDSTARIGFIRKMPKSYKYLSEDLQATVLKSYNIVGDGTKFAVIPILTGKNMYEFPNTRIKKGNNVTCEVYPLLFYKLRDDGYRTAFFEDRPDIGTFQWWLNGFRHQPAHHYLRAFLLDKSFFENQYCVGDTPLHKLMMDLSNQFMNLDRKKFIFTFVSDITHDDFNKLTTADDNFVEFLRKFKSDGHLKNTLLIVMGDHGPRYVLLRNRPQGRLEERLPLMAIVLPDKLKKERPHAHQALLHNVDSLTTPYDIHATLLDAVGLRKHWVDYRVPGADHPRSMTLLELIPVNRSCSEAGVEPHWCACVVWRELPRGHTLYTRAGEALLDYINSLTEPVRAKCSLRTLSNITWVMQQNFTGQPFRALDMKTPTTYQVKITVGPGTGEYEATMTYLIESDTFKVDSRDISRTNMYGDEPACILKTHPYLSPYCWCRNNSG